MFPEILQSKVERPVEAKLQAMYVTKGTECPTMRTTLPNIEKTDLGNGMSGVRVTTSHGEPGPRMVGAAMPGGKVLGGEIHGMATGETKAPGVVLRHGEIGRHLESRNRRVVKEAEAMMLLGEMAEMIFPDHLPGQMAETTKDLASIPVTSLAQPGKVGDTMATEKHAPTERQMSLGANQALGPRNASWYPLSTEKTAKTSGAQRARTFAKSKHGEG